jgi:hypothetical protein
MAALRFAVHQMRRHLAETPRFLRARRNNLDIFEYRVVYDSYIRFRARLKPRANFKFSEMEARAMVGAAAPVVAESGPRP